MHLAGYIKCLKRHALNKNVSDEMFLNAVLKTYIDAGEVDNRKDEELYFNKSRTSLLLNRHDDIPAALRRGLSTPNIYPWTEANFKDFIDEYINQGEVDVILTEVSKMIQQETQVFNKDELLNRRTEPHIFLADALIECIKLKNDGIDQQGEIVRNGAYCLKYIFDDLFKYAFRKRSKEKNIVVIPVDTEFHTHVTRKFESSNRPEVSEKTIHGQFLIRWEQCGEDVEALAGRIQDSLSAANMERENNGKYPIGSIATVENKSTIFYLIAISEFDGNNNAYSSKEKIMQAVEALSIFYDKYGEGYNLYIPLMGTGKSRASISLQEAYDIIVNCYKRKQFRLQGNISIVIHKDFESLILTEGRGD